MLCRLALLLACSLAACATVDIGGPANELPYRCDALVVIGRVTILSEENIPDPAPFPYWQSRWQVQVRIKQVIRGSERRLVVPATSISHGELRDDLDFLAVLNPVEGGGYFLETAAPWDVRPRPRLVEPCS